MNLKDRLRGKLSGIELEKLIKSFEILGEIAIIQVPPELEGKKKIIAEAVCEQHKNVKTVLRKRDKIDEEFRIPKYEKLIGEETETIYNENGCKFKLDPTKVYFSEKLGNERSRITDLVRDGEFIQVWFAGVGPYSIEIAKKKEVEVASIEKNPNACIYMEENIGLNKIGKKVKCYMGDVREIAPKLKKADRIIMPLPKFTFDFLGLALKNLKEGGIIHFYIFCPADGVEDVIKRLEKESFGFGKRIEVKSVEVCGHYSPRVYRCCIDFVVCHQ